MLYFPILYYIVLYHIWLYHILCYIISDYSIYYVILYLIISYTMLYYIWLYHILCYIISDYIIYYVILYLIISDYILYYYIWLYHIRCIQVIGFWMHSQTDHETDCTTFLSLDTQEVERGQLWWAQNSLCLLPAPICSHDVYKIFIRVWPNSHEYLLNNILYNIIL